MAVTKKQQKQTIDSLLAIKATAKDKTIYACKSGAIDGIQKTNKEVADIFSMTAEGIRKVIIKIETLI